MENTNNNLGDYFRKKIGEFDESNDGWGRPDLEIRNDVLSQITTVDKPMAPFASSLWKVAAVIVVTLLAGYVFYLKNQNEDLLKAVKNQKANIEKTEKNIAGLEHKYANEKSLLIKENEELNSLNKWLENEKNKIILEKYSLENKIIKQQKNIAELKNKFEKKNSLLVIEKESSLKEIKDNNKNPLVFEKTSMEGELSLPANIPYLEQPEFEIDPALHFDLTSDDPIVPGLKMQNSNGPKMEVGYDYALSDLEVPVESTFEFQRPVTGNVQGNKENIHSHGVRLAFSPKKNWWVRAGIRMASVNIERQFDMGLAYDRTNEIRRPGEPTSNELLLTSKSAFAETRSTFNVIFDDGEELEEGELWRVRINDAQRLRYFQVPVGVDFYFYNTPKMQWFAQGEGNGTKLICKNIHSLQAPVMVKGGRYRLPGVES